MYTDGTLAGAHVLHQPAEPALRARAPHAAARGGGRGRGAAEGGRRSGVLEVRGLRAERGGRVVLDGVDLRVEAGCVTALVGDSGSGKTSLLRCIVGLDAVAAGDVLYEGAGIGSLDPCELRRRVALVAQSPVMLPGDVRANLLYAQPGADARRAGVRGPRRRRCSSARPRAVGGRARAGRDRAGPRARAARASARRADRVAARGGGGGGRAAGGVARVGGIAVVVVTHDAAQAERLADRRGAAGARQGPG